MKGFITRTQAGLVRPNSFSRNIMPYRGGCAVHWGGGRQNINTHAGCIATWQAWQRFHMETRGWVDIAYTMGFCNHGYVFAGRGFGVRTAAQGTTDGNNRFYAFVWIGGEGQTVSKDALSALMWCIVEARTNGNAGREVRPHSNFTSTTCPGDQLRREIRKYHNTTIKEPDVALTPRQEQMLEAVYKELCEGRDAPAADGKTTIRTRTWQTNAALGQIATGRTAVKADVKMPTKFNVTAEE